MNPMQSPNTGVGGEDFGGKEAKKQFGFVEGKTQCAMCKEILSIKDAHWAFGQWWHRMVKDCHK